MVVTLRDVARAAGVSPATASRALSAPDLVAPARREHVQQVARELGYRPNRAARELITGRTGNLCLVVPDLENPFFAAVAKGVQARARAPRLRAPRRRRRGGPPPRGGAGRAPRRAGGRGHPVLAAHVGRRARPASAATSSTTTSPSSSSTAGTAACPSVVIDNADGDPPGRPAPARARAPPHRVRRRPGRLVVGRPAAARARARVARAAQRRGDRPRPLPSPVRRRRGGR